ncbi:MAG: TonB-dependent receptor [Bacteroidales bacterium]|nr:TonB-dependent receptor [Bacteroidales bacterium]
MIKGPFSLLIGLFSLLAVTAGYGQKAFIKVIDQKSLEPVSFAHVCFEGLKSGSSKYSLTDIDGKVLNEIQEISKIAISYVGFATYTDTIKPGQSFDVKLRPKVLNIDEVVVTAQYTPERADKSIYKVEVINARQIEQKAATNMADLLKDQSTMRVTQDGVLGTSLRIQGMSGENVKFLQDGVPLIGRMNGNFDLNQINLYNVDHVEVIEGPMSVIYGSNALAGVINIITRENKSSLLSTTASAYTESVGVYNFDGALTINQKKHGISLDGGRNFFGGYSPVDTHRAKTFKPRRQYFLDGYYTFTANKMKIKVAGDYFNELLLDQGPLLGPYYETAFDNHFTTIRYSGRVDGYFKLRKSRFINLLGSWSGYNRVRKTIFKDLTTLNENAIPQGWAQDTTSITNLIARGTYAASSSDRKLNYQAGIDISVEQGRGKKIAGNEQEIGDYAAFLSVKWEPVRVQNTNRVVLSIQPGIRFIYNTEYAAPLVYALSAKWNIYEPLNLRFSYSRGFRAPSIKELYLVFVDVNHNVKGNPDLKAEKSNNLNMNLNWTVEERKVAWSMDVSGFYNFIENVILLAQTGNSLEYSYENVSRYKSAGVQLGCSYSIYPAFKLQFGLAETGITGSPDAAIAYQPFKWSTEVTVSPSYRFIKSDVTLSLFYKYSGSAPQLQFDEKVLAWGWVNPYHTMDFTASKGFWNNRIRFSAGVKNIFNTTTIPSTSGNGSAHSGGQGVVNVGWGRTIFAKLSFQFNKYK